MNGSHSTLNHAGLVKETRWEKEKECRLRLKVHNMHPIGSITTKLPILEHDFGFTKKESIDIPYIFLPFENSCLKCLEITFSPYATDKVKQMIRRDIDIAYPSNDLIFKDSKL